MEVLEKGAFNLFKFFVKETEERKSIAELYRTSASVPELVQLFRVTKEAARSIFADALVVPGRPHHGGRYSKASIVDILSELNGRVISYPSEPLLAQPEAAVYLKSLGKIFGEHSLIETRGRRFGHGPLFIRIRGSIRYSREDLKAFSCSE